MKNKLTKKFVKYFIETVPLDIHYLNNKISVVGIHWGYSKDADETFGRKTVLAILNLLEKDKSYQKLLPE